MSDTSAPGLGNLDTSVLSPTSSLLPATQGVDASATDLSLRAIRHVESSWAMPALPDEVRLDLASLPGGHEAVSSLLNGIDQDLNGNGIADSLEQTPDLTLVSSVAQYSPQARSTFDDARVFLASLRTEKPPTEPDAFATQRWKQKAIEGGYLDAPADGVVDGSWDPAYNKIRSEMVYRAVDDQYRGNHALASPIGTVLKQLGDWTSPSGLLRGATDLDLWWDVGQIGKEFSSWGDKWRKVGHSKGVLDFASNVLDAVLGPVDDIAVPAINLALLFTGVGEVANFAKVGLFAGRGVEAGEAIADAGKIYRLPGIGRLVQSADKAVDFEKFGEAGWLSSKLGNGGAVASKVSDGMDAWRAFTPVKQAKKFVQVGMRLGFANQFERSVLGYQGQGGSLNDVPGVQDATDSLMSHSNFVGGFEVLFTPIHLFEPGSFVSGAKSLGGFAVKQLGSAPGRAVAGAVAGLGYGAFEGSDAGQLVKDAAIGAAAGAALPAIGKGLGLLGHAPVVNHLPGMGLVGHIGDALKHASFAPLTNDERITNVFHQGALSHLTGTDLDHYNETFAKGGFQKAFAEAYTGGDNELAGAMMAHITLSASIDRTAKLQAGAADAASFQRNYDLARSKLTAQVRHFDIQGGSKLEDVVWAAVSKASNSPFENKRAFDQLMRDISEGADPSTLVARTAELANHHNMMAHDTLKQLLSAENMPELAGTPNLSKWTDFSPEARVGSLTNYVKDVLPTFGNFTKWQPVTQDLESLVKGGLMQDAKYAKAVGWRGHAKNLLTEFDAIPDAEGSQQFTKQIYQHLVLDADANPATWAQKGRFAPLARQLDSWRGKFGVMRTETVTKQELILAADELDSHATSLADFVRLNKKNVTRPVDITIPDGPTTTNSVWNLAGGNSFHELADAQFAQGLQAAGVVDKDVKALRRLREYAAKNGLTGGDFAAAMDAHVKKVLADDRWTERFGLPTFVRGEDNAVLEGEKLLRAKVKQLDKMSRHTAAQIDRDGLLSDIAAKFGEASPELRQATTTLNHLEASGYKLVHGAEFLMPHDLMHYSGMFRDINERHTNAMTLGNFFDRVRPEVLHRQVVAAQRSSILNELRQVEGHGLHLDGADSTDVDRVMKDLYSLVIEPAQKRSAQSLAEVQHQSFIAKAAKRYGTNNVPVSLQDLGLNRNLDETVSVLTRHGYTEPAARAIWTGLKKGRYAEFKNLGFAAFEAKMRSRNQLVDALHVLSGTKEGGGFTNLIPSGKGAAIVGAGVGAVVATGPDSDWGDVLKGAAIGAVAGKAGSALLHAPLSKAADIFEHSKFARYGYMADNLAALRDHFRFTLSPFFDLRRYSHNHFLAQDSGVAELRFNQSPAALKKRLAKDALAEAQAGPYASEVGKLAAADRAERRFNDIQNEFRKVAQPHFDPAELESTGQYFRKVGILGVDPTAWQASTWHQLMETGKFNAEEAFTKVREMYTYGTTGRSAAEQSVNFIFFPFSFQKKAWTNAARFVADDLSRGVMIHDTYKLYHELDKKYDLGKYLEEHVPVLEKLQQLNLYADGISPGRFGGINAKLFDSAGGALLNLFSPQGVSIKNAADGANVKELVKSLIPAINDVTHLKEDMMSQGHVLFDASHETRAAQAREGYAAWNDYKTGLYGALKEGGYTPGDLQSKPELAPVASGMQAKRDELAKKFPGWVDSKNEAAQKNVLIQSEKQQRLDAVAAGTGTPTDLQFAALEDYISQFKSYLSRDLGITDIADADPSVYEKIQGVAREMLKVNPAFLKIWDRFYRRDFGLLTAPI